MGPDLSGLAVGASALLELVAREVEIGISGAGDATVHATESLKARVSGVGNITYYGDPEHKRTKVSGLGHIKGK